MSHSGCSLRLEAGGGKDGRAAAWVTLNLSSGHIAARGGRAVSFILIEGAHLIDRLKYFRLKPEESAKQD